jgi:arabinoxylan arabinofuranohydrolase
MKTRWNLGMIVLSTLSVGIVTLLPAPSRADNPIVQTNYTADPAPMVYDGRLYLYTSHDEDNTVDNFYTMKDWRLYSTVDMVNWTDHGSPAGGKTFSWFTDNAWAVQGVPRNGKFYLFVPLNNNSGAKIGVGVSSSPAGPFMDPLGKALAQQGKGDIDPTVFIDDDGQAYMYWGNASLRYVKLNSDMTSYTGGITTVALNGFLEGPWFYKRSSTYYMVYAADGTTEKLSYATSSSPTGPWTAKGDIMDAGKTYTNHPGVIDYKGHSYLFYHNSALPGGADFRRSVCVEEFTYGTDGSIPKLTMSTGGPKGIATLDPFQQVEAETIAFSSGLKTETCSDTGGGIDVTSISNGDYIKVKDVDFLDGVTSFDARVSNSGSNAKVELHLDSQTGTLLGTCDVSGASSWATKTCTVTGATGKHDLFLKFTGGSGDLFKFNWWKFTGPSGGGTGGAGGGSGLGGAAGSPSGGTAAGGGAATGGRSNAGAGGTITGSGGHAGANAGGTSTSNGGSVASGGNSSTNGGGTSAGGGAMSAGGGAMSAGGSISTTGGSVATGGSVSASGGRATGSGGVSTAAGQGGSSSADSGCSCHVGARNRSGAPWMLASMLLLLRRRRGKPAT